MQRHDFLVVGAGMTGATAARTLADVGRTVLLVDRRDHPGGNCHDATDRHGILVHTYGPHIFHTSNRRVWRFLSRFTEWRPYQHRVASLVRGRLLPFPINLDTVNAFFGLALDAGGMGELLSRIRATPRPIANSRDAVVSQVGQELYDAFYRDYTAKQWGVPAEELDAQICGRIPVRFSSEWRYFTDTWQGVPRNGFTAMFENMIDHPKIRCELGTDFRDLPAAPPRLGTVFTGRIDEFFGLRHGRLDYRSVRLVFENHQVASFQDVAVVNFPDSRPYTRITEYKKITGQEAPTTTISLEYPGDEGEPSYPVQSASQRRLYELYRREAAAWPAVVFAGRLGAFRYLNMDEACLGGLKAADALIGRTGAPTSRSGRSAAARGAI